MAPAAAVGARGSRGNFPPPGRPPRTVSNSGADLKGNHIGDRTRSESTEDHLERIQELVESKGYARVTDIALALGLSRSAVSNTVRRLAKRGFLNYERYRGFTLTPAGARVARQIRARHETVGALLRLLGLDSRTVDQEVEGIEHHLNPRTLAAFGKLVAFWKQHPEQLAAFRKFRR